MLPLPAVAAPLLAALLLPTGASGGSNCSMSPAVCAPPSVRSPLGAMRADSHAYPRTVYAEHSGHDGQDWGERINVAIQTAMLSSTVVLPLGTFSLKTPIMVWMLRNDTAGVDTRSVNISLANLGAVWAAISGGTPADLSQGLTIEGQGGGGEAGQLTTKMVWKGAADQVMIDIPSPWSVTLRNFMLDGGYTPRLIGVRYRAGYSFGVNGGKSNLFERLSLHAFDVAVDVGGPLLPDLVATRYSQLTITDARIGMRFFGANVAGQWVQGLWVNNYTEAAIKLQGYGIREARLQQQHSAAADAATGDSSHSGRPPPLTDADGDEIFYESIPPYAKKLRMLPCPPYCSPGPASQQRRQAGGGGPSVMVADVVSSSSNSGSWLVDSNGPALHLSHVRLEGSAGIYRNTGLWGAAEGSVPTADPRFMSVLIGAKTACLSLVSLNFPMKNERLPRQAGSRGS